jgi:dipeptidyl aminopeptidase/acylaminoacyl peptidase
MSCVCFSQECHISEDGQSIVKQSDTIFRLSNFKDLKVKKIDSFTFDGEGSRIMFAVETATDTWGGTSAEYYVYSIAGNWLDRVSEYGKQQSPAFSPNGRMVAFVRNNNLFIRKFDYGTEVAVTEDGGDSILNGLPDWNTKHYFPRTEYFAWSADGKMLAFLRFDQSEVRDFCIDDVADFDDTVFDADDFYPKKRCYKYSTAGSAVAKVSLMVYDVQYRSVHQLDVSAEEEFYIPRFAWLTSGQLAVVTLNRSQNRLNVQVINPKSNVSKNILKEDFTLDTPLDMDNISQMTFAENDFSYSGNVYSYMGILKKHQKPATDSLAKNNLIKPLDFDSCSVYPAVLLQDTSLLSFFIENNYIVLLEQKLPAMPDTTTAQTLIRAAHRLAALPYIDSTRIIIAGSGIGATSALLAMSQGDNIFSAGIVINPITDWRFYNALYAERYLHRPQENIDEYSLHSPLEQAKNLQGKVFIAHNTGNEDIYVQNSFVYARRLTLLGKPFEMQMYPNMPKEVVDRDLRVRILNFLERK